MADPKRRKVDHPGAESKVDSGFSFSCSAPTACELRDDAEIVKVLKTQGCYSPDSHVAKRQDVIAFLQCILEKWRMQLNQKQKAFGFELLTFGSHSLGLSDQSTDIDSALVASVPREEVINVNSSLVAMLQQNERIRQVQVISDARVPLIKMQIKCTHGGEGEDNRYLTHFSGSLCYCDLCCPCQVRIPPPDLHQGQYPPQGQHTPQGQHAPLEPCQSPMSSPSSSSPDSSSPDSPSTTIPGCPGRPSSPSSPSSQSPTASAQKQSKTKSKKTKSQRTQTQKSESQMKLYSEDDTSPSEYIDVDLLYVCVPEQYEQVSMFDKMKLAHVESLDEQSLLSLNGYRCLVSIINLIPNFFVFSTAVRFIKRWAKAQGVYGNSIGFLGGISWTLLVLYVCRMFPNSTASCVIKEFFHVFSIFDFQRVAVIVTNEIVGDPGAMRSSGTAMQVPTPVRPSMNTSHNVTPGSLKLIVKSIKCAYETFLKPLSVLTIMSLLRDKPFFKKFRHYLCVKTSVVNAVNPHSLLKKWAGFVQSRIRLFVASIQQCNAIDELRLYPRGVEFSEENTVMFFIGINFHRRKGKPNSSTRDIDLSLQVLNFQSIVEKWKDYQPRHMKLEVDYKKRKSLPLEKIKNRA